MQIIINAPGHPNQEAMRSFYQEQIRKFFGRYNFITTAKVFIQQKPSSEYETSIELYPSQGSSLIAKGVDMIENKAFKLSIQRLKRQISRYKSRWKRN